MKEQAESEGITSTELAIRLIEAGLGLPTSETASIEQRIEQRIASQIAPLEQRIEERIEKRISTALAPVQNQLEERIEERIQGVIHREVNAALGKRST